MNTATMTFPINPAGETSTKQNATDDNQDQSVKWMFQMAAGDTRSLDALIEKWKMPVINFAYRSLGNYEDAEDLALKAFQKLYNSASRYEAKAKFSTYLFTIVNRLVISEIRKRNSRKILPVDPGDLLNVEHDAPANNQASKELEEVFLRALQALPENYRAALILVVQEELSYPEAAEVLGVSEGNLRTQISRGRKLLKVEMEGML